MHWYPGDISRNHGLLTAFTSLLVSPVGPPLLGRCVPLSRLNHTKNTRKMEKLWLFHLQVKECTRSGLCRNRLVSLKVQGADNLHAQLHPSAPRMVSGTGPSPLLPASWLSCLPGWLHSPAAFPMPSSACIRLSVERDRLFPKSSTQSPGEALISACVTYSVSVRVLTGNSSLTLHELKRV